jgi:phosphinothricin acetyltransferase
MTYNFRKFQPGDKDKILTILEYYTENSFAAYPESLANKDHFDVLFDAADHFPFYVVTSKEKIIGFGLLRPYTTLTTFKETGEITYFIDPGHTNKGLGKQLLDLLEDEASKFGIKSILANISSLNDASINFHLKYGFQECGRFNKIGKKFNQKFDVVWMQKFIS